MDEMNEKKTEPEVINDKTEVTDKTNAGSESARGVSDGGKHAGLSSKDLRRLSRDTSPVKSGDVALKLIRGGFSFVWMLLVSTVIAVCIWSYVFSIDDTEYGKTFKVAVDVVNSNGVGELTVYSDDAFYVDVTVSGKRSDMYSLNSDNIKNHISLYVDASNIIGAGSTVLTIRSEVKSTSMDLTIGDVSPSAVPVFADYEATKTVEVRNEINYLLNSPLYEQYSASTELSLTSVSITGPRSVIDTVSYARAYMDLGSVSQSRNINNVPISFVSEDGDEVTSKYIESDNPTVDIKLMVETQRYIPVSIACGSNAEGLTASADLAELLLKGDPAVLDALGKTLELNTEELFADKELKDGDILNVDISKLTLPDGVFLGDDSASLLQVRFSLKPESNTANIDG